MKVISFCFGLGMLCSPLEAATYVFAGEAITIPASGPANPSFIQVEGVLGTVTGVTVAFNNFSHSYGREIMVALSNPNGGTALIFDAPPCSIRGVDLVFADDAENDFASSCSNTLPEGDYTPGFSAAEHAFTIPIAPLRPFYTSLNELILPDPNGRWILWSEDFVGGDGGAIESWELTIETDLPEED